MEKQAVKGTPNHFHSKPVSLLTVSTSIIPLMGKENHIEMRLFNTIFVYTYNVKQGKSSPPKFKRYISSSNYCKKYIFLRFRNFKLSFKSPHNVEFEKTELVRIGCSLSEKRNVRILSPPVGVKVMCTW